MTTIAAYTGASLSLGSVTGTLDHIDTRTFDAQNRTESIHRSLSGNLAAVSGDQFVDFNRNATGRVTRTQRIDDAASLIKSGLTTTTEYDLGRIAAIEHDYLFNRRSRYEVDWTASGDISRTNTFLNPGQVSTSGALYSHDARGQLLLESTFQASGPVNNAYPTDASGNRTSDTVIARDNRLTSDADWNYTYDKEGNLTRKTSKTDTTTWYYTWDHRNRLLTAEEFGDSNPGSSNFRQGARYIYDGFDQLIARYEILSHTAGSIGGLKALNHETYAHEGDQIGLHLVNDTPAVRYLWSDGVDQLLAEQTVSNKAIDWTLTDHLGSVRGRVSSATGALAQHVNFDAFGNPLETQGTIPTAASVDLIFGYTGRPLDTATGQQNNHHRWYDRETGRWLSTDPIGFAAGDTNLYRYVGNQPTTVTDPSGLEAVLVIYVETDLMPANFNIAGVKQGLKQILLNANSSANVLLIPTSRDIPFSERGWMNDRVSYFPETGWYNLNPLQWPVNAVHDCWVGAGDYFHDSEKFYVHVVEFVDSIGAGNIASTSGTRTTINLKGLRKHASSVGRINWDILYANIIAHEVLYLGLLGRLDDPSAAAGDFGSASADTKKLMRLTADQQAAIDEALLCD